MGMSIAVVSQKGGVGKTTLTANLAVAFGSLGFRTLILEVDPQGSLIRLFGLDRFDLHQGLFGCLHGGLDPHTVLETDLADQVDLLPTNVWSHEEERLYLDAIEKDPEGLKRVLAELGSQYDYVLLDCPPSLGGVTRTCLSAADKYLIPVQAEALNLSTLPRLHRLADEIRSTHNPDLRFEGYVATMVDARTRHAQAVIAELAGAYPRDLLETVIPRSIRVAEEAAQGRPTLLARPQSPVGQAFQKLAEEILARHGRERASHAGDAGEESGTEDTSWETRSEEEEAVLTLLRQARGLSPAPVLTREGSDGGESA